VKADGQKLKERILGLLLLFSLLLVLERLEAEGSQLQQQNSRIQENEYALFGDGCLNILLDLRIVTVLLLTFERFNLFSSEGRLAVLLLQVIVQQLLRLLRH
jgi:hypothetical protein